MSDNKDDNGKFVAMVLMFLAGGSVAGSANQDGNTLGFLFGVGVVVFGILLGGGVFDKDD